MLIAEIKFALAEKIHQTYNKIKIYRNMCKVIQFANSSRAQLFHVYIYVYT